MAVEPSQTVAGPLIAAGCAGVLLIATLSVCAAPVPQALFATTVIVPPVLPEIALSVGVIELPIHPPGSVQV